MPQLSAIGIVSPDLDRSRAFYRLLGVEIAKGSDHVEATFPNGLRLMFDTEQVIGSFRPDWRRTNGNQVAPWDAFWGQRYAQLVDPNGVPVDLFATL